MTVGGDRYWVNWDEAISFMNGVQDQRVRNILGLVYDATLRNHIEGVTAAEPFDLLYCFRTLTRAFASWPELVIAIRGDVPNLGEPPDWI
ncbi:MAG: hypothetical protein K8U57_11040 [Planctomycetes bacterium]|nr:hypothetical protein [Planctomycetota bacterium]